MEKKREARGLINKQSSQRSWRRGKWINLYTHCSSILCVVYFGILCFSEGLLSMCAHFRLLWVCEEVLNKGSLEGVDALLGNESSISLTLPTPAPTYHCVY